MYNCPTLWYTVVDELAVDEMSVDELSSNRALIGLHVVPTEMNIGHYIIDKLVMH